MEQVGRSLENLGSRGWWTTASRQAGRHLRQGVWLADGRVTQRGRVGWSTGRTENPGSATIRSTCSKVLGWTLEAGVH